jgi:hypothetical protein
MSLMFDIHHSFSCDSLNSSEPTKNDINSAVEYKSLSLFLTSVIGLSRVFITGEKVIKMSLWY